MLRYALLAIGAAAALAVVFVLLPTGGGKRPEPRILASGDPAASAGFVIHPAAPPDPGAPATPPASPGDLDAVMQRLRASAAKPDATLPQPQAATPPATPTPAPDPAAPPPGRWASVTGQGTRWRMARSNNGYTVSIDLGGGQTADVHVQAAFGSLDAAAVNVRVDYLRETIVQNFSRQSGTYRFARDGSVSIDQ